MTLAITQAPLATFAGPPPSIVIVVTLAFVLFHLSLLRSSPRWTRPHGPRAPATRGSSWTTWSTFCYFGVAPDLIIPMRFGVHLAAATWIAGASSMAAGAMKMVGYLAAVAFLGASFAGPFVGQAAAGQTLGPAGLALVTWLVLGARRLSQAVE